MSNIAYFLFLKPMHGIFPSIEKGTRYMSPLLIMSHVILSYGISFCSMSASAMNEYWQSYSIDLSKVIERKGFCRHSIGSVWALFSRISSDFWRCIQMCLHECGRWSSNGFENRWIMQQLREFLSFFCFQVQQLPTASIYFLEWAIG